MLFFVLRLSHNIYTFVHAHPHTRVDTPCGTFQSPSHFPKSLTNHIYFPDSTHSQIARGVGCPSRTRGDRFMT